MRPVAAFFSQSFDPGQREQQSEFTLQINNEIPSAVLAAPS
jgi:hypothetical protein